MRPFILALAILAHSSISFAQYSYAIEQGIRHTDKGWIYQIQNKSAIPIVAFHWKVRCGGSIGTDRELDTVIRGVPIRGGETYSVPIGADLTNCPSTAAFIYADGQTSGDPDQLAYIRDVRKGIYRALLIVIPAVDRVASGQSTIEAESKQLDLQISHLLQEEIHNEISVSENRGELIGLLSFGSVKDVALYRMPADSNSKADPTFEALIASGMSRDRALATVARQPMQKWMKSLEENGAAQ
ncbi:MAG TPA: hypothetical protein VGU46_14095 [Acidobacteriaceae bacterium]|nr:hypothetical protein [Acidobacteriaceae bacterium]